MRRTNATIILLSLSTLFGCTKIEPINDELVTTKTEVAQINQTLRNHIKVDSIYYFIDISIEEAKKLSIPPEEYTKALLSVAKVNTAITEELEHGGSVIYCDKDISLVTKGHGDVPIDPNADEFIGIWQLGYCPPGNTCFGNTTDIFFEAPRNIRVFANGYNDYGWYVKVTAKYDGQSHTLTGRYDNIWESSFAPFYTNRDHFNFSSINAYFWELEASGTTNSRVTFLRY